MSLVHVGGSHFRYRLTSLLAVLVLAALALAPESNRSIGSVPVAAAAEASGVRWRVGADDFVNYTIDVVKRTDSQLDGFARWGQVDDVAGFHGYEVVDERSVARSIAYEVLLFTPFVFRLPKSARAGNRQTINETLPGNFRLAPIAARGELRTVGVIGTSPRRFVELQGSVRFKTATKDDDEIQQSYRRLAVGALKWTATFDESRGVLSEIEYQLSWTSERTRAGRSPGVSDLRRDARIYQAKVRLTFDSVLEYRYPRFQWDVDAAIDTGVQHLLSSLGADGKVRASRPIGETALTLLALADGGASRSDPRVVKGMAWLVQQSPRRTYETGVTLMALDAYRMPPAEAALRAKGQLSRPFPRDLTADETRYRDDAVQFLLATSRTGARGANDGVTGGAGVLRWGYPRENWPSEKTDPNGNWDNSNTQYGVLGLDAAARLGARVPARVWQAIANHWVTTQQSPGERRPKFTLEKADLAARARTGSNARSRYAPERVPAESRGWTYGTSLRKRPLQPPSLIPYGSMTTGGIGSLAIARAQLTSLPGGGFKGERRSQIETGIRDGLASLDDMFSVWHHANYAGWYTYYLYALERAGVLSGVERFGGHDWYWEGAVQLLLRLRTHQDFWSYDLGDTGSTAWAVLFLKRATVAPVITPSSRSRKNSTK